MMNTAQELLATHNMWQTGCRVCVVCYKCAVYLDKHPPLNGLPALVMQNSDAATCHCQDEPEQSCCGGWVVLACPAYLVDDLDDTTRVGDVLHHNTAQDSGGVLDGPGGRRRGLGKERARGQDTMSGIGLVVQKHM
jgi:hypothetical protein